MRVLIVSGSSGGHIFPALALIDELKSRCQQILLVLPQRSKDNKILVGFDNIEYIHTANLALSSSRKNILGFYYFLLSIWESFRIMIKFKPDVVVGFGSLNTVAMLFWAWLFRIKTVIHEQNVVVGKANRLLAKLADKVAISFRQTEKYLDIHEKKIIFTGNPVRKDLIRLDKGKALDYFKFKEGKFNLVITGGSQGSHKLNSVCLEALTYCKNKDNLQIIHICGAKDLVWLKDQYRSLNLNCRVFDFFTRMQYAYSVADLVISRAGATTISELLRFTIPAILVPYPFAYAHQLENAKILEQCGAALIINDKDLEVEKLTLQLNQFLENPKVLIAMQNSYSKIQVPDAAALLAKEVLG